MPTKLHPRQLLITTLLALLTMFIGRPVLAQQKRWPKLDNSTRLEIKLAQSEMRGRLKEVLKSPKPKWRIGSFGEGRLEYGPGQIPVLRLKGTPEEMGEQHGVLVRHEIRVLIREYLPAFLGRDFKKCLRQTEKFLPFIDEALQREMSALARAAGVTSAEVLLGHTFADQYRAWACSCFAANGESVGEDGELLFGRNLDFLDMGFLHRFSCVMIFEPTHGQRVVTLGFPGIIGAISGLNSTGLTTAVMVVHDSKGMKIGVPFMLLFRKLLQTCKSVVEVETALKSAHITVSNNLMVCSGKGESRVFELTPTKEVNDPGKVLVRRANKRGVLLSTNHFQRRKEFFARMSFVDFNSKARYRTLQKLAAGKQVNLTLVKEGLRKTAPEVANVQSMIFLPQSQQVLVAFGQKPAANRRFIKLTRQFLFGSETAK